MPPKIETVYVNVYLLHRVPSAYTDCRSKYNPCTLFCHC